MAVSTTNKEQRLRYACERCHAHKLRCSRADQREHGNPDTDKPCSRCRKAQVPCIQGFRGKVGRPAKPIKRKAAQFEETCPTPGNDGFGDDGHDSRHEPRRRRDQQDQYAASAPDAQLPPATAATTTTSAMSVVASDIDAEESPRPISRSYPQSPLHYRTSEMTTFTLNTSEVGSWETLMMPQDSFEAGFVPNFDLPPFHAPDSEACFQEPPVTMSSVTSSSDRDILECSWGATPVSPSRCFDTHAVNGHGKESTGLNCRPLSPPSWPSGQLPTPAPSMSPAAACTRSSYEKLSDLNLKINAVSGRIEQDRPSDDRILKDVLGLVSELIDTARQIMPQLVPDTSASSETTQMTMSSQAAKAGRGGGGGGGKETSLEPEPSTASEAMMPGGRVYGGHPRRARPCMPDSTLVFLLLASYSGVLNMFEVVVDELWARHGECNKHGSAVAGGSSVSSLLETSLAVHTINYLFRLLREALFPRGPRCPEMDLMLDGIDGGGGGASWCQGVGGGGGGPSASPLGGRGSALGLLRTTCDEMREREQTLLRRTQHLQQLLIR